MLGYDVAPGRALAELDAEPPYVETGPLLAEPLYVESFVIP